MIIKNNTLNKNENSNNTFRLLYEIWKKLTKKRKRELFFLINLMLISGFAELFSLAAVLPFLSVITDAETVWKYQIVREISNIVGIYESDLLIIPLTFIFIAASVIAAGLRLLNIWLNFKFAALIGSDLSSQSYKLTLYQPYEIHIKRNSSNVITALSRQIDYTVYVIGFALQLIASCFVVIGLLIGLILVNWIVAFGAGLVIGGIYLFVIQKTKKRLLNNGRFIANSMQIQLKHLQEGLGGIRDIILDNSQKTFLKIYNSNDFERRIIEANTTYLRQFPKLILESISIVFIAILGLILISTLPDKTEVITILGTLALGAQRLLPAAQQIYANWVSIKSNAASVKDVINMLNQPIERISNTDDFLTFNKEVELNNVSYSYGKKNVLNHISFKIKKGAILGIVGETGSGKSTLADLLMGLIQPNSGFISVDGIQIYNKENKSKLQKWRNKIAHIPQNIFLADASVSENIAFGIETKEINFDRVVKAAKISRIHDFIQNELGGYDKFVGEKGINLSGGQLQRIGIARALYKKSNFLVMDEATSAMDENTERKIIESIYKLKNRPTIIMIAHRLSTLKNCDQIIHIHSGEIIDIGKPKEILGNISENYNF